MYQGTTNIPEFGLSGSSAFLDGSVLGLSILMGSGVSNFMGSGVSNFMGSGVSNFNGSAGSYGGSWTYGTNLIIFIVLPSLLPQGLEDTE